MMQNAPAIPVYGLFGESAPIGGPAAGAGAISHAGFVHIETIAERSRLHNWEITPHRHAHATQVLVISEGFADVTIDGAHFALSPPGFVVLPMGSVHGFRFRAGTLGHVLTLSVDFLARCGGAGAAGGDDPLRRLLTRGHHAALSASASARVARLAEEMLAVMAEGAGEPLLQALAESLLRSLPSAGAQGEAQDDRRLALLRHLIEVHLREHRGLDFYAASLGCTERTLNRLCRARLGQSPLALINTRLALEAQRLLRYTNASVAEVADALGFADPSYFSRFYLRMTGRRPRFERLAAGREAP